MEWVHLLFYDSVGTANNFELAHLFLGKIKFLSNGSSSEMEISFPYTETGMLNMKHYQIVSTDYDRYALVWRCQRTIFGHRRAAQIMSRQPTIEKKTLVELQSMLKQLELDDGVKLNEVNQSECQPKEASSKPSGTKPSGSKSSKPAREPVASDSEKTESSKPTSPVQVSFDKNANGKNKKKLLSIDVGGFHLSINLPFWWWHDLSLWNEL